MALKNQHPTFILAESDQSLRRSEAELLQRMGYSAVVDVADGVEAWSALKNFGADFVIAGWEMPEMNGLALLKVMRADANFYSTPMVLITDGVTKGQVIEAGEAGVSDIIIRPFTPETFRKKVALFLNVDRDPQYVEAEKSYTRGLELMDQGRYEEALEAFKRILSIYENAEIYYNMGYIKTAQGFYEEAIHFFRRATQINNAFARAYQKMGECHLALGNESEAQMCLERAAEIYMDKHMDDKAESVLKEVAELNPKTINVYNSLGIIYRRQGRHREAIDQYRKALRVNPMDANIYYNIARAHLEMEELIQAQKILRKAIKIEPESLEFASMLKFIESRLPTKLK